MPLVLSETHGPVLVLTLNRPERLNAVTPELFDELSDAITAMDTTIGALVLTGAGKGFCAGGDIRAPTSNYTPSSRRMRRFYHPVMLQLEALDIPFVAAVNGPAVGAGLSLAAAADIRMASERATFSSGFATVGLSPDNGATHHLVRVLGYTKAFELLLQPTTLDARTAETWGLVNSVVDHGSLLTDAITAARRLADLPGIAGPSTKRLLKNSSRRILAEQLELEAQTFDETSQHPDRQRAKEIKRKEIS